METGLEFNTHLIKMKFYNGKDGLTPIRQNYILSLINI